MKRILALLSFLLILITPASPAHAAPIRGEIVSITPAAPVWGDAVLVHFQTDAYSQRVVVECYAFGTSHVVYHDDVPANGRPDDSVFVDLTFGATPVAADCVLTLVGNRLTGGGKSWVLDEFAFTLAAT